jgi:hypothetical protein
MSTAEQTLALARAEIGYVEGGGPHGNDGNITKYWADLAPGFQGQPWCAAFYQWLLVKAGVPLVSRSFYVPSIEADYKRAGRLFPVDQGQPGDQLIYAIGAGHTGILVSIDHVAKTVTAIEGNTSSGTAGSQDNGGGVYLRTRPWSLVKSLGRPQYSAPVSTPTFPEDPDMMMVLVPNHPGDAAGRAPVWQTDKDGNLYCWNGAPPLKSLDQVFRDAGEQPNHPPICAILAIPDGSGVILVGDDAHEEPSGEWVRSTYKITG